MQHLEVLQSCRMVRKKQDNLTIRCYGDKKSSVQLFFSCRGFLYFLFTNLYNNGFGYWHNWYFKYQYGSRISFLNTAKSHCFRQGIIKIMKWWHLPRKNDLEFQVDQEDQGAQAHWHLKIKTKDDYWSGLWMPSEACMSLGISKESADICLRWLSLSLKEGQYDLPFL